MAAVSRHLPRGLAQACSATLRSASNLEKSTSAFSRSSEAESSSANLGHRGEFRRESALELKSFCATELNPTVHSRGFDLRSDKSRYTIRERCSDSLRSPGERQDLVYRGTEFAVDHDLRRISPRASYYNPSTYNVRSVWTAVSDEDKLRPEVDDEELDLTAGEENLETTTGKKRNGLVAEDAESSMYTSVEGSSQLTAADVHKFLKLRSASDMLRLSFFPSFPSSSRSLPRPTPMFV